MASNAEIPANLSTQEAFIAFAAAFPIRVKKMTGYAGDFSSAVQRHIGRHRHGWDDVNGMRDTHADMISGMAGTAHVHNTALKENRSLFKRQSLMTIETTGLRRIVMKSKERTRQQKEQNCRTNQDGFHITPPITLQERVHPHGDTRSTV